MRWVAGSIRVLAVSALLWACTLLGAPSAWADVSGADQTAIQAVISSQIDAFRHDNAGAAFGFATPELQTMFGSPERFMAMVQHGYAPVYRPRSLGFGALSDAGGDVVQFVELVGPDGLAYTARYTMQRQDDGAWRISACELLESRRVGA